jgi:hypothetical protein
MEVTLGVVEERVSRLHGGVDALLAGEDSSQHKAGGVP